MGYLPPSGPREQGTPVWSLASGDHGLPQLEQGALFAFSKGE